MHYSKKHFNPAGIDNASPAYLLLAVAGLSFCFFLGFPFDNHNESFLWIIVLNKVNFWDTLTKQVIPIESFRPLGVANAWLSYKLSGNIYLQQILNWLFALSSYALLFKVSKNRIFFSLLSLIVCACFFAGYIYLFHLHGVFYGPFQLYVAALTYIAYERRKLSSSMLAFVSVTTLFICLYHTFALLVFVAFLSGYLLQLPKKEKGMQFIRLIVLIVGTLILAKIILHTKSMKTAAEIRDGLLTSFQMAEINKILSGIAIAITLLATLPLIKSAKRQAIAAGAFILLAALLMYTNIPVLILWIVICFIKTVIEKNLVLAALIAATAILPAGSSSGSPTYIIFVLMICVFVTSANEVLFIPDSLLLRRLSSAFVLVLCGILTAVKAGFPIPGVQSMVRPVLAEKEKTYQLKDIIGWKLKNKEYEPSRLVLYDAAVLPVASKNAVSRINRPVVSQNDLNSYVDFLTKVRPARYDNSFLYITFGNKMLQDRQLVFSVNGPWNGKACVFR